MNKTDKYYEDNATNYILNTLNLDMSVMRDKFMFLLPSGGTVLDIGCGSGRDLKVFKDLGFDSIGIEPSSKLQAFSANHSQCEVVNCSLENFNTKNKFDGIWACASLLHMPQNELAKQLLKIHGLLKPKGKAYLSFKYGDFSGFIADQNGERYFCHQTIDTFNEVLPDCFNCFFLTITNDQRQTSNEKWLNVIIEAK